MAKRFGMHALEVRPGMTPAAFEPFVHDDLSQFRHREGQVTYVPKGDRGARAGKYLFVFTYARVAQRHRATPAPNQDSEELTTWLHEHHAEVQAVFERLSTFVAPDWDIGMHYTDYVVVGM